jgi:hypothetical protein
MIFTERALLHNPSTISELEYQRIALLVAKELAEQVANELDVNAIDSFDFFCLLYVQMSSGTEILSRSNGGQIYGFRKRSLII